MKLKTLLLAGAASLVLSGAAQAEHFHGWYVGIEGGANWVEDVDFVTDNGNTGTGEFDTGWAILGTVGYAFTNHWRLEGEVGWRSNDLERVLTSDDTYDFDGSLDELTLMANVVYDIPLSSKLMLSLGAGVGADRAKLEVEGLDDTDWNFAYQGIAGLNYAVSARTTLFLNYRYLHVDEPEVDFNFFNGKFGMSADDFTKHTVTIGLRYDLVKDEEPVIIAPPPPPPPAVKQFIVFFGFNKCNITSEADAVLSEAAASAKSTGSASIVIVGHTDTVGSNKYNQKLSECRANAAKSNLEGKGISAGSISASGRGETELMVQTGDGVKEPQNRRATIDLQ